MFFLNVPVLSNFDPSLYNSSAFIKATTLLGVSDATGGNLSWSMNAPEAIRKNPSWSMAGLFSSAPASSYFIYVFLNLG